MTSFRQVDDANKEAAWLDWTLMSAIEDPAPGEEEPDGYRFGTYDFGLTDQEESRARSLHQSSVIVDLLYWGPLSYRSFEPPMEEACRALYRAHHNAQAALIDAYQLPGRMAIEGRCPQLHRAWSDSGITAGQYPLLIGNESVLLATASHFTRITERLPWIRKVDTADDLFEAKRQGQLAWFGLCQPSQPISTRLSLLDRAHDLGLRVLMLTYNEQDAVGAGCLERTDSGLSKFGERVVHRCNDLGIVIDTAHCGRQTTLDACERSATPVIASHTSAAAVYPHDRGKSDEELEAIAATGGVIGVVTVPFFLARLEDATLQTWLDHVDYISDRVGWQHVAIVTDWPMAGPKWTMERLAEFATETGFDADEHGTSATTHNLPGFDDYRDLPNLTRGLVSRGYGDEQIRGILGANALRAFAKAIG